MQRESSLNASFSTALEPNFPAPEAQFNAG
jgi:hypothetical protein